MSERFMKIKKFVIPTITMVIIASQLMGCAATSQSELLGMINNGDAIEIEVATPANQEQGVEQSLDWVQLDQLQTQPELRKEIDDIFKIAKFGENSKNGVFYIDLEGNQEGNNTLYNTFANSKFRSTYWENEEVKEQVATAASNTYADIEFQEDNYDEAVLASINGYFNILRDSSDGYANMDSTVSRLEAMSGLFRADNQVTDSLSEDADFNNAVDPSGSNEDTIYASNMSEQSYLDIESKSLDELTAKGTMTRGELAYMLVQTYFADDYNNVDLKGDCYNDVKNGGDIATKQKFIEKDTKKDHWKSYELSYALQNPDKGCPESIYKALIVAKSKGIITTSDSRWDEGVTKKDFLEMLTNSYLAISPQLSADLGTGENGVTMTTEEGDPIFPDYAEDYVKFTSIDPTTKYVIEDSQVYNNPNMTEGKLTAGGMEFYGNQLTVDATCNMDGVDYFRIKPNNQNLVLIIPASVLADELPSEEKETPPEDTSSNSDTTTSTTDNTDDNSSNDDIPDDITYEYVDIPGYEIGGDIPQGQDNTDSWSDVDPAALEAAQNMILE